MNREKSSCLPATGEQLLSIHYLFSMRYLIVVINARLEHIFAYAAQRAAPVSRKIFESSAGSNAVFRIAFFRIISISTGIAKIFFHNGKSPYLIFLFF